MKKYPNSVNNFISNNIHKETFSIYDVFIKKRKAIQKFWLSLMNGNSFELIIHIDGYLI